MPREAPTAGYQQERTWHRRWADADTPEANRISDEFAEETRRKLKGNQPPVAYIFRVRTVLNEKGEVVNALYGKLQCAHAIEHQMLAGELSWRPFFTKTAEIKLAYCLNPDGTRNLEFDVKKNLFKGLDVDNMVTDPW